jgi:signal transduction histidine kinase
MRPPGCLFRLSLMNKSMHNPSIFLSALLLANAALAALLGLSLAVLPQGVLGLFPAAVKPGSFTLLQAIGVLLFGMSLSLWTLVDVRRTDALSRVSQIAAVGLVFAWITLLLISRGVASPDSDVPVFVSIGLTWIVIGVFAAFYKSAGRHRALDPAGESAAQQERKRLARDLHDSIKQQLFSIKLSSAAAEERWESDPGGARIALADVRRSAHAAMVEMQAMLSQLRPEPLATAGLVEALREQCEALGYRSGIPVRFEIGDLPPDDRLADSTRENLFRIAQEALTNVARHARAREVEVRLGKTEQDGAPALLLQIRDDGQGFDVAGQSAGMGLRNMRERLEAVHGTLDIRSAPGEGTEIRACAPLTPPKAPGDPIYKLANEPWVVIPFLLAAKFPSFVYVLFALYAAVWTASAWRGSRKTGARYVPSIQWRLFKHQQRFLLLTWAFWWACAVVPTLEVLNPPFRWLAVPLFWLNQVVRFSFPALILLAFWEAWSFFRLRRSRSGSSPESGLPVGLFAAMVAVPLVSIPLFFLSPIPWPVFPAFLIFHAILYLGWRLRKVS